jgi:hypothetical protein
MDGAKAKGMVGHDAAPTSGRTWGRHRAPVFAAEVIAQPNRSG